ncbi:hypothetical protein [Halorubrum sp. DTA46]
MSRAHVVCRDCLFEGLAPSVEAGHRAVDAHRAKEDGHTIAIGLIEL